MKKILVAAIFSISAISANAQIDPLKELECKGYADAVQKAEKNSINPKQSVKSGTWVKLAEAYVNIGSRCSSDSMAAQKAYDSYAKALEIEKAAGGKKVKDIESAINGETLGKVFLQQGANFYTGKNMIMASKFFGMSSKINAKDTLAALYSGIVEQSLGNNDAAKSAFAKYMSGGGQDPAVFYSLAQILKVEKKFDEAIDILRKGSALNPKDKDLKNEIINTYIVSNNIDGAITDLTKMIEVDPSNVVNLTNLGLLYDSKTQDVSTEINKIKEKLEKSNTSEIEKRIASEQDKLSVYEGEIANLTAKLKKEPKTAVATKKRITEVTSQKNAIEEGLNKLKSDLEAKKNDKSTAELASQIPALEAKQKEFQEKSLGLYNKVLAVDPNNYDVNFNMAVLYFNQAVETKKMVDAMDMKSFQKDGKAIEDKACMQFSSAKPYFDKCKSLKADDDLVNENLKNLNAILEQCKK